MDGISKHGEDRSSRNSGFFHSERIKMLDITRDKPIKIAVRVAVPVKDHPKFNFVGKLLGPKGNSMKRLQEDTMCKMAVLGRGSMKDRKREEELKASGEPRYAHLAEDLHVEITTFAPPAEAHARIAYALAEVRRFLVPDYHDDIRQEQMWEMQAISSSSSQTQTGEQNSPTSLNDLNDVANLDSSVLSKSDVCMENAMHQDAQKQNLQSSMGAGSLSASQHTTVLINSETHDSPNQSNINNINNNGSNNNNSNNNNNNSHNSSSNNSNNNSTNNSSSNNNMLNNNYPNSHHHLHVDLPTHHHTVHPSAVAAAIHHQLAAGMGIIKPSTGVASITGLTQSQTSLSITSEAEATTPTLTLLEPPILHPALRGVKTVNIATGNLARKRPLLGVPRSSMNPTKRTVMTLLARAKNSQALHANVRNNGSVSTAIHDPLHMLTSPFLFSHHLHHQGMNETLATAMVNAQKENLSQVV